MDAWIKVLVVLVLVSALSMIVGYIVFDPFVGLILLGVVLTLLVLTVEPATGKAMAQVTVPIIIILFAFQTVITPDFQFQWWMLLVVGAVLYMMFTIFTGGGSFVEGAFIDAKVSFKLFPLYAVAIFIATVIDPTNRLTVYIMIGTIFCLMILYAIFLRNYDEWPLYQYGTTRDVEALTDINPNGKVKLGAEIWWAKTTGPPIQAGEKVVIVGLSGLTMLVTKDDGSYDPSSQN
ncbi:MAG: conserved membrane protein of unknown function [Candidatus Thorarchaeota archaeon]|nr:MAG: conserved membrane protein of unknown function [Candidatus Thorarchaeota archaeon]